MELEGIGKTFGRGAKARAVLGGVSLTVEEGEFVSLLGPSGSGKTTLFQIIGGLETADEGAVRIAGEDTTGQTGHIAYMPQQASLLPWKTVAGNIELALAVAGRPKGEAKELTAQWLERIGLSAYAASYPDVLSGGMQQRVSFLRALLSPQPLMCLDEPFGALDALTRLHMQQWLLSLWEENRRSVLFVTHSIDEALMLSDRIVVLSGAPAAVIRDIRVPLGRPRSGKLWTDPLFNEMKQQLYEALQPQSGEERKQAAAWKEGRS
ncbi:nitrate ABC transporter ATP-binding protein [Paenibacillus beijingensis]|uniref:Nitrate ABC transporter ATP-binding protein n=1 Tax=Paenibacillus beijingensis TaxID=1126833 RepID=A0A0D5NRV5_9BACL|nr:nitrate ABC transporter ATP-binding protein [Paenibacillus beijingensis]